ncbi:MAG: siphovirus Gp157 family protein [Intestinibacter sp.]|uniref:siphovirus Gp157 family protein n=1 Tax=Intestinibacter sp. TaxID=1965304 RepID=UPI003F13DED2
MNLYQLTENFLEVDRLIDEYMEAGQEDLANNLVEANKIIAQEIQNKSNGFVYMFRNIDSQIDAIDGEIKRLQELKKQKQNKYEYLKKSLKDNMEALGVKKLETDLGNFTVRNNPGSLVIDNETIIPDEYKEVVQTVKIDKKAIKECIKQGNAIEGCHVEISTSLMIPKAKK